MELNGTTGDVFCEYLVKREQTSNDLMKKVIAVIAAVLVTLALFIFAPVALLLAVLVWIGVVVFIRSQKVEFEYAFTSGMLDVDKLVANSSRKTIASMTMEEIEVIAPVGSHELDAFAHGTYMIVDASAHNPAMKDYCVVGMIDDKKAKLLFTPNEKMLDKMFAYSPRRVKRY